MSKGKQKVNQPCQESAYNDLKKFNEYYNQLGEFCDELVEITKSCVDKGLFNHSLLQKINEISQQIKSKILKVAIVGEFSRGKSTLLNALLGQRIQPIRDVPCNGTITRFRHGNQQRVTCHYKDGRQEKITLQKYYNKVTIPPEVPINNWQSNITEIIFEDPDLKLCQIRVEILDSPGLNEHPERESITQKLLTDTDAVIFLINANQPLTSSSLEYQLLSDIRFQLNGGGNQPAQNLFVVVNFWDLVSKNGRHSVQQRVQNLMQRDHPIINSSNRIHFICAKSALEAVLNGTQNEYTESFNKFVTSLDRFLAEERGKIKISDDVASIQNLIEKCLKEMDKLNKTLEKICKAIGFNVKIKDYVNVQRDKIFKIINESWNVQINTLEKVLHKKTSKYSSKHYLPDNPGLLIECYIQQFYQDLSSELDNWIENKLKQGILEIYLKEIDNYIKMELQAIKSDYNVSEELSFWGNIGLAGLDATALMPDIFPDCDLFISTITEAVRGLNLPSRIGFKKVNLIKKEIQEIVLKYGYQRFKNHSNTIFAKIDDTISQSLSERVEWAEECISDIICFYEGLLEQKNTTETKTLEQNQQDKVFIQEKRHELEKLRDRLKSLINELEI